MATYCEYETTVHCLKAVESNCLSCEKDSKKEFDSVPLSLLLLNHNTTPFCLFSKKKYVNLASGTLPSLTCGCYCSLHELLRKAVCNSVVVEPELAVRKLPRVQHLNALVAGRLRSKDDEVENCSSLC